MSTSLQENFGPTDVIRAESFRLLTDWRYNTVAFSQHRLSCGHFRLSPFERLVRRAKINLLLKTQFMFLNWCTNYRTTLGLFHSSATQPARSCKLYSVPPPGPWPLPEAMESRGLLCLLQVPLHIEINAYSYLCSCHQHNC